MHAGLVGDHFADVHIPTVWSQVEVEGGGGDIPGDIGVLGSLGVFGDGTGADMPGGNAGGREALQLYVDFGAVHGGSLGRSGDGGPARR